MMRVLLDVNIVLDVLLKRIPWNLHAELIMQESRNGSLRTIAASHSITTIFYIARRLVGNEKAKTCIHLCLEVLEIQCVDKEILESAYNMNGPDFEDSVQIAAALRSGVDAIVTRDPAGFIISPVPIVSPAQLSQMILETS